MNLICTPALADVVVVGLLAAGEEGPVVVAVHRDVEDARVVVEHVLDAVAVVHVPVKDHDALGALRLEGVLGGHGHVVEDAEPAGLVLLGVVAGRADDGGAAVGGGVAVEHGVDDVQEAAAREERALQRGRILRNARSMTVCVELTENGNLPSRWNRTCRRCRPVPSEGGMAKA